MTIQLSLLEAPIASPLCCYESCPRQGRAVLGRPRRRPGCVNRSIVCLECRRTGTRSENTEARS